MLSELAAIVLITIILILFVTYTVYLLIIHHRYSHVPTPKGRWFYFGHIPTIASHVKDGNYFIDLLDEWAKECGPIYSWWKFHQPVVVITHPDAIKELASSKYPKPLARAMVYLWNRQRALGNSLFTIQHYEDWKDRRRIFDPAFAKNYLNGLVPQFTEVTHQHLIQYLDSHADGKTVVDMKKQFSKTTLQVISWVAFGTDFSKDPFVQGLCGDKDLLYLLDSTFEGFQLELTFPMIPYLRPFAGSKYIDAAYKLRQIGRHCIEQRIKSIQNNEDVPHDILTQIISITQKEENIQVEDLVDDFVTFYAAGQETTSNLLSFTLIILLQNPDILESVVSEIDEVMGDKDTLSTNDLDKLTYTNAVLEESLRLYPPAPIIAKQAGKDVTLLDTKLPKGTFLMLSSYIMQRNPEYFDDPLKFDPSRFEPGQKRPSPYVFFPFGIGHRICIGRLFAMMEAKVILALLLHYYVFTLPPDYKLKKVHAVTTKPVGGIPCTLISRKK